MKNLNLCLVVLGVLATSCATNNRSSQTELKKMIVSKDYAKATEFVNSEKFLNEKNNELLKLLEKGRVYFLGGKYYQAIGTFDKARDLSDQLFTTSVSKKAASLLLNDNADNFYGENYERSMVRFYQSLTHMMLYRHGVYEAYSYDEKSADGKTVVKKEVPLKKLTEQEARFHLTAAKSVLIEWDSQLTSIKAVTGGEVTFKDDLMAKMYGAFVHENSGSPSDKQVAKDLYKAAKGLLLKNYDIYQAYNSKYKEFRSDFSKFATMPIDQVEKNYVTKTESHKNLLAYIDNQISEIEKGQTHNCLFVLEEGLVQEKKLKKFDIPLIKGGSAATTTAVTAGGAGFISFALKVLDNAKEVLPKIYFELPEVPMPSLPVKSSLVIETLDGKRVQEVNLQMVNPMSEIANQALDERSTALYTKTGIRVAGKHLAALLASYAIYNSQKSKGDFIAMTMASLAYKAANKGIEMSEQADLRSWQTLPQSYKLGSVSLPVGEYKLKFVSNGVTKEMEKIKIVDQKKPVVFDLSI